MKIYFEVIKKFVSLLRFNDKNLIFNFFIIFQQINKRRCDDEIMIYKIFIKIDKT